jgi:hypothetical protein
MLWILYGKGKRKKKQAINISLLQVILNRRIIANFTSGPNPNKPAPKRGISRQITKRAGFSPFGRDIGNNTYKIMAEEKKDEKTLADVLYQTGEYFNCSSENKKAMDYFDRALPIPIYLKLSDPPVKPVQEKCTKERA